MPLFWLSMATFVAGITGALAQLWMGYIGDRLESRFGRRRPFIAVLSILGGIAIISLMFPPEVILPSGDNSSKAGLIVWFFVFFTVVEVRRCVCAPHPPTHPPTRVKRLLHACAASKPWNSNSRLV
jgi:solute carrier family 45 protein 1/2/4